MHTSPTPRRLVEDLEDTITQAEHIVAALERGFKVPGHTIVSILVDCVNVMRRARNFVRMEYLP